MGKIDHPEHGAVCERRFPGAVLDDELRACLRAFKEDGIVVDFQVGSEEVKIWRSWVDGELLTDFFGKLKSTELVGFSRMLFDVVHQELEKLGKLEAGHGALHPGNILYTQDHGIRIVDPMFNALRLAPHQIDPEDPWLWGAGVPEGWTIGDWDRVSLLRTAALLAGGSAAAQGQPLSRDDAIELCHEWAEKAVTGAAAGANVVPWIEQAKDLLDHIRGALFPPALPPAPDYPVEEELAEVTARQDRMFRDDDDRELRRRAVAAGVPADEAGERIDAWLLQHDLHRERELVTQARQLLEGGRYPETGLVGRRACAAAERTLTFHGLGLEEAQARVGNLMREAGWTDERQAAVECRRYLDGELAHRPISGIRDEQLGQLIAGAAAAIKQPQAAAERLVRLDLERRHFES